MNLQIWLLRAARWLRHPPSPQRLALIAVVVALALALAGLDYLGLWPQALTLAPGGIRP